MSDYFRGTITADEREKLYNEIWSEPVTEVAKRYGISDVGLRKHCVRYGIPLPYRGYWARVRNGQKLSKVPLPPVNGSLKNEIRNYLIKYKAPIEQLTDEALANVDELSLLTDETKEFIHHCCSEVCVKDQLRKPHSLIVEHKEEMAYRKKRDRELKRADFSPLYYSQVKSKYRDNKASLPIFVSDRNINRAYRILDTLIKAIGEMEGCVSIFQYESKDSARLVVLHTGFEFEMKEKSTKVKKNGQEETDSTLMLSLSAHSWFSHSTTRQLEYKDTNHEPLELQVGKIIYDIFVAANQLLALGEIGSRKQNRQWEEEKRQHRLEEMRKKELKKVEFLSSIVSDWDQAQKIRKIAEQMESLISEKDMNNDEKTKILSWIKWARNKADWLDPLTAKEDELLEKKQHLFKVITKE